MQKKFSMGSNVCMGGGLYQSCCVGGGLHGLDHKAFSHPSLFLTFSPNNFYTERSRSKVSRQLGDLLVGG